MRGPKPKNIILTNEQITIIKQHLRSGKTEQRVAKRARILLLSFEGENPCQTATKVGCDRTTVWRVCRRFEKLGLGALNDAPRSGAPRKFSPS